MAFHHRLIAVIVYKLKLALRELQGPPYCPVICLISFLNFFRILLRHISDTYFIFMGKVFRHVRQKSYSTFLALEIGHCTG